MVGQTRACVADQGETVALRICKGLAARKIEEVPDLRAFGFFETRIPQGRPKEDCRGVNWALIANLQGFYDHSR
jgi:hypothetical protein